MSFKGIEWLGDKSRRKTFSYFLNNVSDIYISYMKFLKNFKEVKLLLKSGLIYLKKNMSKSHHKAYTDKDKALRQDVDKCGWEPAQGHLSQGPARACLPRGCTPPAASPGAGEGQRLSPEPWAFQTLCRAVVSKVAQCLWLLPERVRMGSCHKHRVPSQQAASQSCCHWGRWGHLGLLDTQGHPLVPERERARAFLPFLCSWGVELRIWSQSRFCCLFAVWPQACHLFSLSLCFLIVNMETILLEKHIDEYSNTWIREQLKCYQ